MTRLADAEAVTAVLHADVLTGGQRWAIVAGLARTANHLVTAAGGGDQQSPDVDRALIIAEASSAVLFQFAALDPPAAMDYAALHRAVPDPSAHPTSVQAAALEASAALVHATRPGTGPQPIADILAITTAATTACQFVATTHAGDADIGALARDAARAWADVRGQLTLFNDGSRRPQTGRPPAVEHALTLHRTLKSSVSAQAEPLRGEPSGALIGTVVERLALVAHHLDVAVADSVARGQFMAYAVDLSMRESRVRPFLEGHRAPGLVTGDAHDLAPVRSAMTRAQASTAGLAAGMSEPAPLVGSHRVPLPSQRPHVATRISTTASARDGVLEQLRGAR